MLAVGTPDLVIADTIGAADPILAPVAACAAVQHVGFQVLAPAVARGLTGWAHAPAVVAVLAGLVAALTTLATVFGVREGVLPGQQISSMANKVSYVVGSYTTPTVH